MNTLIERFTTYMESLNLTPDSKLCAALSGGSDSMALTILLKDWCTKIGYTLSTVTVDHRLRPESSEEAQKVQTWMTTYGIPHTILQWPVNQHPNHVTQENARHARYELLLTHCRQNRIPYLLTAHQSDDQAETLLMRFLKGSDVMGLAGIPVISSQDDICLVRPLLQFSKEELIDFLHIYNIPFVEDPSNKKDLYLRNRLRHFLQQEKIPLTRFSTLASKFAKTRSYFENQIDTFLHNHVKSDDAGYLSFPTSSFKNLHPLVAEKTLTRLLMIIGDDQYPPRSDSVERLLSKMTSNRFETSTLNGCEIFEKKDLFYITREIRKITCASFLQNEGLFDDRFSVILSKTPLNIDLNDLEIRYLNQEDISVLKTQLSDSSLEIIPPFLRQKLIGIFSQKNLVSVPQVCYFEEGWHFYIKFLRILDKKKKMFTVD